MLPATDTRPTPEDSPPTASSAREAGATWAQIGDALGITKQAAHDFYRRRIEGQEKYVPDLHDAAAARGVLDD